MSKKISTTLFFLMVIIVGVFFRFANLDAKVYWRDESLTSLRISGYTGKEMIEQVFTGQEITVQDLGKYQQINPEIGFKETLQNLAIGNPHHPPLYYSMARFWVQAFGESVPIIRSLSALISLLVFPGIYWLCRELFEVPIVGWVGMALIAVSPFHVLYAQEAREYSLWTVGILFASAALLRSLKQNNKTNWTIYILSLVISFYTFLFSVFVAFGHGIYALIIERCRFTPKLRAYLLSSIISFIAFIPWIIVVVTQINKVETATEWATQRMDIVSLVKIWLLNLVHIFFDLEFSLTNPLTYLSIPILILITYSLYYLYRHTTTKVWLFTFTLIGVTALVLIVPDLIMGGRRSTVGRYLIPCYLGIEIAVAYLLASKISHLSGQEQQYWKIITVSLLSLGVLSCVVISQAETWWNKYEDSHNPPIAQLVNRATNPHLLVLSGSVGQVLSLQHLLEPQVRLRLYSASNPSEIPADLENAYLLAPSQSLISRIEARQNYRIKSVYKSGKLWQVQQVSN